MKFLNLIVADEFVVALEENKKVGKNFLKVVIDGLNSERPTLGQEAIDIAMENFVNVETKSVPKEDKKSADLKKSPEPESTSTAGLAGSDPTVKVSSNK